MAPHRTDDTIVRSSGLSAGIGTPTLTLTMQATADLDMAVKFGSEIASYEDGGDWLQRDIDASPEATLRIDAPEPGRWYVDVFNVLGGAVTGSYTLDVR